MRLPALIFCILIFFYSCRKPDRNTGSTITAVSDFVDTITVAGCNFVGDNIHFSTQIKSHKIKITSLAWNFGDGSAPDSNLSVLHAFNAPGTYTVTVTVNGESVSKTINIIEASSSPHALAMGKERKWKGVASGWIDELNKYYADNTPIDIAFTINPLSERLVTFSTAILTLAAVDTTAKTLSFVHCGSIYKKNLVYYYNLDSLVYYSSTQTEIDKWSSLNIHTY